VFDFVVAEDVLPKVLLGYGPLPPVVSTSGHTGPWDQVGSRRIVHLRGGDRTGEEITAFERPEHFAYRVGDFSHALKYLASHGGGEWWFDESRGSTLVRWTYSFTPRSPLLGPVLWAFVRTLWRGYMRVALDETRRQVEDAARRDGRLGGTA
jgi:hypothetical protein